MNPKNLEAPAPDTAEVSIFGNGCGEAILVHLGRQEWLIIDSCLNPKTRRPAPLEYLEQIKLDPAQVVKMFLISHWHSDHIRGGAELYRNCANSVFVCSDFLIHKQMLALADPDHHAFQSPLAIKEFSQILQEVEKRKKAGPQVNTDASPRWAAPNRRLLYLQSPPRSFSAEVYSLSPPDAEKSRFLSEIGRYLQEKGRKKEIISKSPNCYSVVVWISMGKWNLLLGADLENVFASDRGWNAILMSSERPEGMAQIVKIPHHGSRNAHNSLIWREMVQSPAIALLTPFDGGKTPLPTPEDKTRLCNLTSLCYSAALTTPVRPKRRSNSVERQLQEMSRERKVVGGKFGQVRLRFNPLDLDDYEVALIEQARPLCEN